MKQKHIALFLLSTILFSCGQTPPTLEETCATETCSETEINAPVPEANIPAQNETPTNPSQNYRFPAFNPDWGIRKAIFDKAEKFYDDNYASIPNKAYVTIIDFSLHSSKKRLYLFDLRAGTMEKYLTSHGAGSDPDNDGYATLFSNVPESKKSSLGFYYTLATYNGSHGYSMRIRGLESTNSNAESRAIVIHPATYVQEKNNHAGRSWGCPALDPSVSKSIIDRIKSGSLLLIDK